MSQETMPSLEAATTAMEQTIEKTTAAQETIAVEQTPQDTTQQFVENYEKLKKNTQEQKRIKRELLALYEDTQPTQESNTPEQNTTPEVSNERKEQMEDVVEQMQEIYTTYAEKYLPEGSSLKKDILAYYEDKERLYIELSNVYTGVSYERIKEEIQEMKEAYENDKNTFLVFVSTRDYSLGNEEIAFI